MAEPGNMDIKQHKETYGGVTALLKWGTVASALVGMIVIILISS